MGVRGNGGPDRSTRRQFSGETTGQTAGRRPPTHPECEQAARRCLVCFSLGMPARLSKARGQTSSGHDPGGPAHLQAILVPGPEPNRVRRSLSITRRFLAASARQPQIVPRLSVLLPCRFAPTLESQGCPAKPYPVTRSPCSLVPSP